ncbi:MAG: hypothetical protein KW793_00840 [Candidatus Doudnabacteria bacterium]|nr:hypothetical protein [Candidatus Doudnabacteria bacterium]
MMMSKVVFEHRNSEILSHMVSSAEAHSFVSEFNQLAKRHGDEGLCARICNNEVDSTPDVLDVYKTVKQLIVELQKEPTFA